MLNESSRYHIRAENFLKIFLLILFTIVCIRYFQSRLFLSDLKVYYGASRILMGWSLDPALFGNNFANVKDSNPYLAYYGLTSGYYKYAPFFLILFSVFAIIPWKILSILYPIINILCFYVFFKTFKSLMFETKFFSKGLSERKLDISFILCIILQLHNIYREIIIGNLNIFLMLFLMCFMHFCYKEKYIISSLFFSFLILIKPHFIFIVFLLFMFKKYKIIFFSGIISFLLFFSIIPIFGFSKSSDLILGWISAMKEHNNFLAYLSNSLNLQYIFWEVLHFIGVNTSHINQYLYVYLFIFFSNIFVYIFLYLRINKLENENKDAFFVYSVFILVSFIPFLFVVDANQLLYTIPFISCLMYNTLINLVKINKVYFILFIALILFIISTQHIPRDWLPLNLFMGASYLMLIVYSCIVSYNGKLKSVFFNTKQ